MSSRRVYKHDDKNTGERLSNGLADDGTDSDINDSPAIKTDESRSWKQETVQQSTINPKTPVSSNFLRATMLFLYFWTCVYV